MLTAQNRVIAHVDMDAFFAAVEQRDNPLYRGRPVIVGGPPDAGRGVVSTCSYEARAYGVRSAMPLREAARLCPHAIFLPVNMAKYAAVSRNLFRILQDFSASIEPVSVDEAYLDLSLAAGSVSPEELGGSIKRRIFEELHLTASVGISWTKFAAKIGSDLKKPNGLRIITTDDFDQVILPLELERVPGIGVKAAKRLHLLGLHTIEDLTRLNPATLTGLFGKYGAVLYQMIRGIDPRPVISVDRIKSVGSEMTFPTDIISGLELRQQLKLLSEEVSSRLERRGCWARTVVLKGRLDDFTTLTRSRTLFNPLRHTEDLYQVALSLLGRFPQRRAFRLLGVSCSNLTVFQQLTLFDISRTSP